jgi:hypothetical protein
LLIYSPEDKSAALSLAGSEPQWSGLLRGFLIAFSFIGSLFTDVRICALPNSGRLCDSGYLLSAAMFLGGCGAGMEK